jgi:prevent-host-death family protein
MRRIAVKELQSNIEAVLNSAQDERIVISRGGKPCAVLVGIENHDAEDLRLANSAEFWRMIHERRSGGKSVSLADVEVHLGLTGQKASKRKGSRKGRRLT